MRNRVIQPGTQIKFMCGDIVERNGHEGIVVAIIGNDARVSWPSLSNAKEDVDQDELTLVKRRKQTATGPAPRPATIVESPRAKLERWMRERA